MSAREQLVCCAIAFTLLTASSSAQWQAQSGVPDVDYYGVERFDGQTINGAGTLSLLRSTDNGAGWDTTFVTVFGAQFPCALYDVHFFTTQEGVASGLMSLGSQFVILRTTDAGANWEAVYISNTGGLLRWIQDIEFGSATEGFAVGSDNRLLRTTNGGQNWTELNPPSGGHLYDIRYGTGNVRHIAGDGRILRSTDGGTNWTAQYFPGSDLRALHFPSALRGYAAGESGAFLRTNDGGLSWTPMEVPIEDRINDLFFISDDEGYATAGTRIWHTMSGGAYWEWFECGHEMRAIEFSGGEGIAVGEEGALFRSNPGTAGYHPVALFELSPDVHCADSLIVLTNLSEPTLGCTWLQNGNVFATSSDASLVIDEPQQTDTISLVVNNGQTSDTLSILVSIAASLNLDVQAVLVQDTLCNGGSTQVQVPASVSGISYRLRRGTTNIGSAQNGNGNTLTFSTGTINGPDTLNVLGTRVVNGCGTGRDSTYLVIHSATPQTGLIVTVVDPALCIGENTDIVLSGSENGVSYQLKKGTQNIGAAQTGTGGDLTFNSGPLEFSTTFTLFATHPFGCTATLATSATVTVERPEPYFALSSLNPEVGDPVTVTNTSAPAVGYDWDFSASATPSSSALEDPGNVVFNTPGTVDVSLTITSPSGCTNTAVHTIHVIEALEPGACDHVQGYHIGGGGGHLAGMRYGQNGDVFLVTNNASSEDMRFYSSHGDTLVELLENGFDAFSESYQVIKFASTGVPQWLVRVHHGSTWAEGGDVVIDDEGNFYMAFFHGEHHDSLSIYSSDQRKAVTFMPPWDGSSFQSAVVISWDPLGLYRWHRTFLEPYWLTHLRLALDAEGGLYATGPHKLVKFDRGTGAELWTVPYTQNAQYNEFADMCITPDGTVHVMRTFDLVRDRYEPDGTLSGQDTLAETIDVPGLDISQIVCTGMVADADGSIYLTGNLSGRCVIGSDTLEDLTPSFLVLRDLFITRIDPDGEAAWSRQVILDGDQGYYNGGGIRVDQGHVVAMGIMGEQELGMEGHPPVTTDENSTILLHLDTSGENARISTFPAVGAGWSSYFHGAGNGIDGVAVDDADGRMAVFANYGNTFDFGGTTIQPHMAQYTGNVFVGLGGIDCFIPSLPSPTATPVSWFTADLPACSGQPVQFTDASLNDATSWSWTFAGGSPTSSDQASPVVTFSTPGIHVVTLSASNGNGTGTTFTMDLDVEVCTGMSETYTAPIVQPTVASERIVISASGPAGRSYRIIDAEGREIAAGTLSLRTEVDVRALAPGGYIVTVPGLAPVRFVVMR